MKPIYNPDKGMAACEGADPNIFFPKRGASSKTAKAICALCRVRTQCLAHAIETGVSGGIWGGVSHIEIQELSKQRKTS